MKRAASSFVVLVATLSGCDAGTPLEQSCDGEAIPNCRPYEYSVATAASLGPPGVEVGDRAADVTVHVELDHCGDRSPEPHRVVIQGLANAVGGTDAGATDRIFSLGEVRDDGRTGGDPTALDGVIDATIPNPFIAEVPPSTNMVLRFIPRIDVCEGEAVEVEYRTGRRFVPPGPGP